MDSFSPLFAVGAPGLSTPGLGMPSFPLGAASNRLMGPSSGLEGMQAMMMMQQQMILQLFSMLLQLMSPGGTSSASPAGFSPSGTGSVGSTSSGGGSAETGGGSFNTPGGVAADPSQFQGGTAKSRELAAAALRESTDGDSQGGWCSRDVGEALRAVGLGVARGDAWTKAAVLAKDPRFRELKVGPNEIDRLPPGAIIVWDKGPGLPYGHISVALGDGREASDLLRKQMHLKTSYRVFLPI